jgi:hypothetical protein
VFIVEITSNPSAMMQYVNYEEAIIQHYGIELKGWTYNKFVNPSELSTAVDLLCKLLNAITSRDCKFVKLTGEECQERLEAYNAKLASGELKACTCKTHSDSRKKKKRTADEGPVESSTDDSDDDNDGNGSVPHQNHMSSVKC